MVGHLKPIFRDTVTVTLPGKHHGSGLVFPPVWSSKNGHPVGHHLSSISVMISWGVKSWTIGFNGMVHND